MLFRNQICLIRLWIIRAGNYLRKIVTLGEQSQLHKTIVTVVAGTGLGKIMPV